MARWVIHLRLMNFYLTAEMRLHRELCSKPVAVVRGGEVLDASPEAAEWGASMEMRVGRLRQLCPEVVVLPYEESHYGELDREVWDLVAGYTPVVEPVSSEEGFFDLSGCIPSGGSVRGVVRELRTLILEKTNLKSFAGGGPNKLIARLASGKGVFVREEGVRSFLASLPVASLGWMDRGMVERLERLGVVRVGDLASLPEELLAGNFPGKAELIRRVSLGVDLDPVIPLYPSRREEATIEFDGGEEDGVVLERALRLVSSRLASLLFDKSEEAGEVSLSLSSGRGVEEVRRVLSRPVGSKGRLGEVVRSLFRKSWKGEEVRGIRLSLSGIRPIRMAQLDLYRGGLRKRERVDEAVEGIRRRYGEKVIIAGGELGEYRRMAQLIVEEKGGILL